MQVSVRNIKGEETGQIEVLDSVFGLPFNEAVVHQALLRQQANARLGTANTKRRGEVAGSTRKLYMQKHTGRARAGSLRSPLRRGGGVVFGPHPRSYAQRMPKKMRRLAIKCMLSDKLRQGEMVVVDEITLPQAKTKAMADILKSLQVSTPTLVVTPEFQATVILAARNLPRVKTLPAPQLNVVDLLSHKALLITTEAVRKIEALWGEK
ncbi:MAG: 50S ribosomal protein L4 [Chloroflexota bacterium]